MKQIKLNTFFFLAVFLFVLLPPVFAERTKERIVDNAGRLSTAEKAHLTRIADTLSNKYNFDLVLVIEQQIPEGIEARNYADEYFDVNGYGFGQNRDGSILLIVMAGREWHYSNAGRAINILKYDSYAERKMYSEIGKNLRAGNFSKAYEAYFNIWEKVLELDVKGRKLNFFHEWNLLLVGIAWFFAIAIGFITVLNWEKGMNTAVAQKHAGVYIIPGTLDFKEKSDTFLYSQVTKTKRSNDSNSSSSGSSGGGMRSSSSGMSFSGRGGKF